MAKLEESGCVSGHFSHVGPGAVEIKFASTPRPHNSRPSQQDCDVMCAWAFYKLGTDQFYWPDHVCRYALSPELTPPNTPPGCIGNGADNPRGGIYQVCKTT